MDYLLPTVYLRFEVNGPNGPRRAPLLERLVMHAATETYAQDWREEAFRVIASGNTAAPAVAAAALDTSAGLAGQWACVATPVHLVAGMTAVTMPDDGRVAVTPSEASTLAADFGRVFGDNGVKLVTGRPASLLCVFDRHLEVSTRDPALMQGRDVFGFQPSGADAPRLRRLMSEMEMWLFDHEVNRARLDRGMSPALPLVTGLWLWGGGTVLDSLPSIHGWTAGSDLLFAAFGTEAKFPAAAGAGVVVCDAQPGTEEWADVESRWLAPAWAALRRGRIDRLVLSCGERRYRVRHTVAWRVWRRPRPWWETFSSEGETE